MTYVLTIYPLSRTFRQTFEQALGVEPTYLSVSDLRKLPVSQMISPVFKCHHVSGSCMRKTFSQKTCRNRAAPIAQPQLNLKGGFMALPLI